MGKERNFNPVQAQRKSEKAKAIKKGKAEVQAKRNERLAKRNPDGIQKQIADLKAITDGGGKLTRHEEQVLEGLEKEHKAVVKAREALGDKAPSFSSGGRDRPPREGGGGVLGKRRRGADGAASSSDSDEEVPDDVKSIPMPRDTPPPIPKEILDRWWAKRRAKRGGGNNNSNIGNGNNRNSGSNANAEPLANDRGLGRRDGGGDDDKTKGKSLPPRPTPVPATPAESRVVYEAKPMVRDLRKEAVSTFVPAAVRTKLGKTKGEGGLMEPEEADRLEQEGYLRTGADADKTSSAGPGSALSRNVVLEEVDDEEG